MTEIRTRVLTVATPRFTAELSTSQTAINFAEIGEAPTLLHPGRVVAVKQMDPSTKTRTSHPTPQMSGWEKVTYRNKKIHASAPTG